MQATFYLRSPAAKRSAVILTVTFHSHRLRISTDTTVITSEWDGKKQRVKKTAPSALETNAWLDKIAGEAIRLYNAARIQGTTSIKDFIKSALINYIKPCIEVKAEGPGFFQYADDFVARLTLRESSIKVYNSTLQHLRAFETVMSYPIAFDRFTGSFYEQFLVYLYQRAKNSRTGAVGVTNNAVAKYISTLKTILKHAAEGGWPVGTDYLKFRSPREDADTVALTIDELSALENYDLSGNDRLRHARDVFLLQCYTGLRYSDIENLRPESVDLKGSRITVRTVKTKDPLWIPITPKITTILDRYPELCLPVISNQKMNKYVKEICELAGIATPTLRTRYKGGEVVEEALPKWKMIGTHTARRTFITLSLQLGMPTEIVMKISGHRKREQFQKYVRHGEDEVVRQMKKAWK